MDSPIFATNLRFTFFFCRIPPISTKSVVNATVNAVLKNKKEISEPLIFAYSIRVIM
jgi:hypothetical protein